MLWIMIIYFLHYSNESFAQLYIFCRSIVTTSYFNTQPCNTCSYLRDIAYYVYHFLKIQKFF